MGNAAFKDERWDDAITYYSQAINKDSNSYVCYANRSAAYLKNDELIKALEDAGTCITIKPSYNKGHIRRVAVYHMMEDYEDAIDAYKQGLQYCPNDDTLQKGLKSATKRFREQQAEEESSESEVEQPKPGFRF